MEWVETTGKTVDEAKELALDQLGVDEHEAEFELLEEPKTGLFGR
ncbi:MAG: Jag N-terminal domain-containing protein, partial [Microthrixaceae bacterium]